MQPRLEETRLEGDHCEAVAVIRVGNSTSLGYGSGLEVASAWRRCAKLQKGLPDGQGRRVAPPGQIGRKKLFKAGRYRLIRMADGLVCVTQAEDGELVLRF